MKFVRIPFLLLPLLAFSATKPEFEAATIKASAPQVGHSHGPSSAASGGPGTADPALYRCTGCNLAFLISQAYELRKYQFPGQSALPDQGFDVMARVPAGATHQQFQAMLQGLLQERFGLAGHFEQKPVQGYELVVGKNGPNLKESKGPVATAEAAPHKENSAGDWHALADPSRTLPTQGVMVFMGQGKYRGDFQTMADLATMISNQLSKPVDDRTGLTGHYDLTLNWTDDGSHNAGHQTSFGGFEGHGDHGGEAAASGPTLMGALQAQLGLRLEAKKATANIFVVDHVEKLPAAN